MVKLTQLSENESADVRALACDYVMEVNLAAFYSKSVNVLLRDKEDSEIVKSVMAVFGSLREGHHMDIFKASVYLCK